MSPNEWRNLKSEMTSKGFEVQIKGRSRKEMICTKGGCIIDIYKGGITGSSIKSEVFIYDSQNGEMMFHEEFLTSYQIIEIVESYVEDFIELAS